MRIEATFRDENNMGLKGPDFVSKLWILVTFSSNFHWFNIGVAWHGDCKYSQRYVEYGHQMPNFGVILGLKIGP